LAKAEWAKSTARATRVSTAGTLRTSVEAFQQWFGRESGGLELRTDVFRGELDIAFVRLSQSDALIASSGAFVRDRIEAELHSLGFNDRQKIYGVYYAGSSNFACGGSPWPPTLIGNVAALYLRGTPPGASPCATSRFASSPASPGYVEFSMIHELMHSLGAVATCAPHFTAAGHVSDDPSDLMYAGSLPWRPSKFDVGHDDYFMHSRPDCLDITNSVFVTPTRQDATPPPGWAPLSIETSRFRSGR
jgi:hypothetical protein